MGPFLDAWAPIFSPRGGQEEQEGPHKGGPNLGSILRPKRLPKRDQNGARSASKSKRKISMKQEGFQDALEMVLGLSWLVLGSILGSKMVKIQWFLNVFVKIMFLKKIRLEMASWTDLGSIWAPKGVPKGSQIGPNIHPKWDQKSIKN